MKQEFRSLTDVAHPNLVTLYELLSEGDEWFFTMELVEGVPFTDYVRRSRARPSMLSSEWEGEAPTRTTVHTDLSDEVTKRRRIGGTLDVTRLRQSLAQVAEAVCAIHEAGFLHGDIKPSNVLVTPEGRAVLLDFGLVSELRPTGEGRQALIAGTPAYMSPEQTTGRLVTAATDWYTFGVMLFEAMVGDLPYRSSPTVDRPSPSVERRLTAPIEIDPTLPADLNALCLDLLQRDPDRRPTDDEVLRRLTHDAADHATATTPRPRAGVFFIGRDHQLAELRSAYEASRHNRTVIALVRGRSGMGKSALVQRFLQQARHLTPPPVVLAGRCYERESVPFKALDSLVDALTFHLKSLPLDEVRRALPPDAPALARLFPVLSEVDAVTSAPRMTDIADAQELRRRAFAAFRAVITALSVSRPLVLFIDDLQWGDLDSGALLGDLLRPPDPPRLLLIGVYRSEESETSVFLRTVTPALRTETDTREIEVAELTPDEALRLARTMTHGNDAAAAARARAIVEESGGSPFFIDGLARHAAEGGSDVRLDEVIDARVSQLPPFARHLLELAAVAGRPLDLAVATAAATIKGDEQQMLGLLRARRLARTRGAERPAIEIYHDRIRESVAAHIPSEVSRVYNARLAEAWEASGRGDPEVVATHHHAAGRDDRAEHFAGLAAIQAEKALAFDRAARLYRWLLDLRAHAPADKRALHLKLGNALANAGRGDQAANAFLAAGEGAPGDEAAELERRAAEQLLRMGKIDEGLAVLRTVLARAGLRMARTPTTALLSIIGHRMLITLRGLGFRERRERDIPPAILRRIDACWSAGIGLSMVDTMRGNDFHLRNLLFSLRAGEPRRLALAFAMQIPNSSFSGGARGLRRMERLRQATMKMVERVNDPQALAVATVNIGIANRLHGRYRESLEHVERGAAIFRERCTGVAYELQVVKSMIMENLLWLGAWHDMFRRLPEFLQEADSRSDVYGSTYMRVRILPMQWLAQDRPDQARDEAGNAIASWSAQGFHLPHYQALFSQAAADLYTGQGAAAWERLARNRAAFSQSMLLHVQAIRIEFLFLRARAALAAARGDTRMLRLAARDARRLERTRAPWARGMVSLIRAGIAAVRGDSGEAERLLAEAERRFVASDLAQFAHACRRRRGELLGGQEGRALLEDADRWFAGQQVVNPARMARMLAPGAGRESLSASES